MRRLMLENVFLTEENNILDIKLCEFFFCADAEQIASEHDNFLDKILDNTMYIGEHRYNDKFNYSFAAPEMLPPESSLVDSKRRYGFPADMWSLGCVVYNLCCGVPPFTHNKSFFHFRENQRNLEWKDSPLS